MNTCYLVDLKGSFTNELACCRHLDSTDHVIFLTAEQRSTLTFQSPAKVTFIALPENLPSVDPYIQSALGYLIGKQAAGAEKQRIVIVKRDRRYDNFITFWTKQGVEIARINDLGALALENRVEKQNRIEKRIRAELRDSFKFSQSDTDIAIQALKSAGDGSDLIQRLSGLSPDAYYTFSENSGCFEKFRTELSASS